MSGRGDRESKAIAGEIIVNLAEVEKLAEELHKSLSGFEAKGEAKPSSDIQNAITTLKKAFLMSSHTNAFTSWLYGYLDKYPDRFTVHSSEKNKENFIKLKSELEKKLKVFLNIAKLTPCFFEDVHSGYCLADRMLPGYFQKPKNFVTVSTATSILGPSTEELKKTISQHLSGNKKQLYARFYWEEFCERPDLIKQHFTPAQRYELYAHASLMNGAKKNKMALLLNALAQEAHETFWRPFEGELGLYVHHANTAQGRFAARLRRVVCWDNFRSICRHKHPMLSESAQHLLKVEQKPGVSEEQQTQVWLKTLLKFSPEKIKSWQDVYFLFNKLKNASLSTFLNSIEPSPLLPYIKQYFEAYFDEAYKNQDKPALKKRVEIMLQTSCGPTLLNFYLMKNKTACDNDKQLPCYLLDRLNLKALEIFCASKEAKLLQETIDPSTNLSLGYINYYFATLLRGVYSNSTEIAKEEAFKKRARVMLTSPRMPGLLKYAFKERKVLPGELKLLCEFLRVPEEPVAAGHTEVKNSASLATSARFPNLDSKASASPAVSNDELSQFRKELLGSGDPKVVSLRHSLFDYVREDRQIAEALAWIEAAGLGPHKTLQLQFDLLNQPTLSAPVWDNAIRVLVERKGRFYKALRLESAWQELNIKPYNILAPLERVELYIKIKKPADLLVSLQEEKPDFWQLFEGDLGLHKHPFDGQLATLASKIRQVLRTNSQKNEFIKVTPAAKWLAQRGRGVSISTSSVASSTLESKNIPAYFTNCPLDRSMDTQRALLRSAELRREAIKIKENMPAFLLLLNVGSSSKNKDNKAASRFLSEKMQFKGALLREKKTKKYPYVSMVREQFIGHMHTPETSSSGELTFPYLDQFFKYCASDASCFGEKAAFGQQLRQYILQRKNDLSDNAIALYQYYLNKAAMLHVVRGFILFGEGIVEHFVRVIQDASDAAKKRSLKLSWLTQLSAFVNEDMLEYKNDKSKMEGAQHWVRHALSALFDQQSHDDLLQLCQSRSIYSLLPYVQSYFNGLTDKFVKDDLSDSKASGSKEAIKSRIKAMLGADQLAPDLLRAFFLHRASASELTVIPEALLELFIEFLQTEAEELKMFKRRLLMEKLEGYHQLVTLKRGDSLFDNFLLAEKLAKEHDEIAELRLKLFEYVCEKEKVSLMFAAIAKAGLEKDASAVLQIDLLHTLLRRQAADVPVDVYKLYTNSNSTVKAYFFSNLSNYENNASLFKFFKVKTDEPVGPEGGCACRIM